MQKLLLKNITFLFLFFGTALSFADTKINISESFSEEEKAAIQKMFKNFTRLKGRSVSFYYSQFFDPNSLFETTLDGTVLVEFLEERFKSILPMPESDAAPKKKSDGTEYFSIGYQKPKLVQNIEEGTSEYVREEIYLNRRFINGDINRQLSALGLLLHEAHHSGKGDPHPHVDCPSVLPTVFNRNSDFSGVKGA